MKWRNCKLTKKTIQTTNLDGPFWQAALLIPINAIFILCIENFPNLDSRNVTLVKFLVQCWAESAPLGGNRANENLDARTITPVSPAVTYLASLQFLLFVLPCAQGSNMSKGKAYFVNVLHTSDVWGDPESQFGNIKGRVHLLLKLLSESVSKRKAQNYIQKC